MRFNSRDHMFLHLWKSACINVWERMIFFTPMIPRFAKDLKDSQTSGFLEFYTRQIFQMTVRLFITQSFAKVAPTNYGIAFAYSPANTRLKSQALFLHQDPPHLCLLGKVISGHFQCGLGSKSWAPKQYMNSSKMKLVRKLLSCLISA